MNPAEILKRAFSKRMAGRYQTGHGRERVCTGASMGKNRLRVRWIPLGNRVDGAGRLQMAGEAISRCVRTTGFGSEPGHGSEGDKMMVSLVRAGREDTIGRALAEEFPAALGKGLFAGAERVRGSGEKGGAIVRPYSCPKCLRENSRFLRDPGESESGGRVLSQSMASIRSGRGYPDRTFGAQAGPFGKVASKATTRFRLWRGGTTIRSRQEVHECQDSKRGAVDRDSPS